MIDSFSYAVKGFGTSFLANVIRISFILLIVLPLSYSAEKVITDYSITQAIEDEFIEDQAVSFNEIDVSTRDGIVTLSGTVNNILSKERAKRITESVKGVREVINNILVMPPDDISNQQILDDVRKAIISNPATENFEVEVSVGLNGVVMIMIGMIINHDILLITTKI